MPKRIQAVCWIQFWAWIGKSSHEKFTSLSSVLTSSGWFPFLFYASSWVGETYFKYDAVEKDHSGKDMVSEIGRIGSTALICFSIVTFCASIISPWMILSPEEEASSYTPRPPPSLGAIAELPKRKPALITAWFWSHFIFVGAMGLAPFVSSFRFAATLVALCGL